MKQQIKAYTLMEVTVAMLLSAICITLCYSAYGIITGYYHEFGKKNETIAAVLSLKQVLERDFLKSKYVLRNENEIILINDSTNIKYLFDSNFVARNFNELHTDTFKLTTTGFAASFEKIEIVNTDTIDHLSFDAILPKHKIVPIQINKIYSSENLFN
jgi:Tfp pilus assembly protein PilE